MLFADPQAAGAPAPEARFDAVAGILADEFGMEIGRFAPCVARLLIESLPPDLHSLDSHTLGRIATAFSIGETFFMRHPEQFGALSAIFEGLPSSREGSPLKLWSAGCATGEEAYSLAATLAAANRPGRVLGTDINSESLGKAQDGRYRLWSLRGDAAVGAADWLRVSGTEVAIAASLRGAVDFSRVNLMHDVFPDHLDAVMCRNVLLYFNPSSAQSVYRRMADSVLEGGVLFIGYTDPEPGENLPWREETQGGVRYFRKCANLRHGAPPLDRTTTVAQTLLQNSRQPDEIRREARRIPHPLPEGGLELQLIIARGLSSAGLHHEALAAIHEAATRHPLSPESWILGAMIAEESGDPLRALRYARKAHLLIPSAAIANYLLAVCLGGQGEPRRAATLLEVAAKDLFARPLGEPVPHGEGLTVKQLARMVEMETLRHE
jgi:chemotaxis protein methyltransferase CheR